MSQQAAANSPYATADHQKLHAQHQAKERKHSYRSIELDERMFGCDGAAQLQEEENARAAAALASLGERRSAAVSIIDNAGRKDAMSPSDNTPIPVLDAVLFWTESVETEELQVGGQAQLLADIQGIVIPYLRNVVDDLQITEDKLLTADDTYAPASVPAASAKRGTRGRPSAGRRSSQLPPIPPPQPRSLLLPLFLMPPSAVLQGAFAMQAARRDILRIFECPHVQQYRDGGGTPCGQSLGVVIRKIRAPVVGKASLREAGREAELGEISEDQVIWLYKPAVTAAGKESASAKVSEASDTSGGAVGSVEVPTWMQRRDRSVSLVIRPEKCATKTAAGSATADHTEVRVVAERSVTSLRTCTFKPNRSVASLVLSPPPDTACLILPNSSCYSQAPNAGDDDTSGVNESLLVYRGGVGGIECPDGVLAQREGARQSLCFAGWCAGAYEVLHYLFFPGTTCFIQYLQTDVAVNSPATLSAETQTVHAATSQPTISEASTAATAAGSVQWELLVVANDGSAAAGTFDRKGLRVLRTIPLPCVPTLCEKLISLEQQKQKPGRGTSATEVMELFPTCMVELTAAGNSGLRALSVIAVCGAADVADSNAPAATCSKPTQPVHMASRKRRSPPTEKNHYIALSMGSFKLLRQRAHLQARLSAVRGALRSLFAIVLLIVAALVAAVLVEYAYMQLQRQRPPPLPTRQETAPPTVIEDPFNVERLAAVPDALMVPDDHKVAMSSPVDFTFQDRPEDVDTTADTQAKAETEIAPTKEAARVDHEAVLEFIAAVEQQCERQNGRASVDPSPVVDSLDIAFGHPEDDSSPAMEPTLQSVPSLVAEKEKEEEAFLSVQPTQEHRKDECAAVVPSELAPESELPVAVPLVAVPVPVEYLRMPAEPAVEEEYLTILPSEPSQSDEMWQAPNIVFEPECRAFVTDYMLGDSFAAEQVVRTDAGAALEIRPAAFLADRGADLGTNVVGVKVAPEEHEQHTCISTDPASESSMDDNQLAPGGTVHHTVNMGMDNMGIDVDIGMGDLRLGTEEQADLLLADTQHALPNTFPRIESARDTVRTAVRALHPYYNRYLRRHHERWIDALRSTATYTDREVRRGARYIADSPMAQTLYANAVLLAEFVSANVRHYVPIFYYALYLDKLHRAAEDAYAAATPHVQMAYAYCEHQTAIFGEAASTLWHSVYQSVSEFLHDLLTATRTVGAKLSRSMCELRRGADAVQESTLLYCAGMQRGLQDIVNRTAALLGTLLEGQKELWRNYVTAG